MKLVFQWLLAGSFALLCAIAPARAQNTDLGPGIASLAQATGALVALSDDGALLLSSDLATPVREADSPRALLALAASGSTVIAMGDSSSFVRSTNSGSTYSDLSPAVDSFVGEIQGLAAHAGTEDTTWIAVGRGGGAVAILLSTDNGASWSSASVPVIDGVLNGVARTADSRWLAVGTDALGGVILTSPDGVSWTALATTLDGLNAIATDGAGKVLIVGDAGTILYATDGGATSGSFAPAEGNATSEDLHAVAYLSDDDWIIGGDSSTLVSVNGTTASLIGGPVAGDGAPVTALLWTGSGANYYVSSPSEITPPEPHGPISLQISLVAGQLQLTLVGAEDGNSYHITTSTTLASFTAVADSTQAYSGGPAPTWTFPVPAAGGRVFYRAVIGVEP